jgi:predicted transposase YbfD/YdcC
MPGLANAKGRRKKVIAHDHAPLLGSPLGPDALHDADVLAAVKDKPCGWSPKKRPSLTAAPRAGSTAAQVGTKGWPVVKQRDITTPAECGAKSPHPYQIQKRHVETRMTLAHTIAPGGNEVEGALQLLDLISLKGCIVTGDGLHCNRKMAKRLHNAGADYALTLKANQFDLAREAKDLLESVRATAPCAETSGDGHGRFERRCAIVVAAKELGERRKFPGLAAVARVDDWREIDGKLSHCTRMFALSQEFSAERVLQIVRSHWSIENHCHWSLDIVFHEDLARNRKDHGPQNLSMLRRLTMNILHSIPTKGSIAVKRKRAAWNNDSFFEAMTHLR